MFYCRDLSPRLAIISRKGKTQLCSPKGTWHESMEDVTALAREEQRTLHTLPSHVVQPFEVNLTAGGDRSPHSSKAGFGSPAWGKRSATASISSSSARALDSRHPKLDVGLHLQSSESPDLGSPNRMEPRTSGASRPGTFRVAGDRNDTTTDDPNYRAWKYKWLRSRGSADSRVDGAMLHASLVRQTLVANQSFLLPLDYQQLKRIQTANERSGSLGRGGIVGGSAALDLTRRVSFEQSLGLPRLHMQQHTHKVHRVPGTGSRSSSAVSFLASRAHTSMS